MSECFMVFALKIAANSMGIIFPMNTLPVHK